MSKATWKLRLGVLVSVVFLLAVSISHTVPQRTGTQALPEKGTYAITSWMGQEQQVLEGQVYFEVAPQVNGIKGSSVFKLHFINARDAAGAGFGLMIPISSDLQTIAADQYEVPDTDKGFLNRYESVFGYADTLEEGSSLYFTESGSISIQYASTQEVSGIVDLRLTDNGGHSMELRGPFHARPLNRSSSH
ncbi:hypothetical protein OZ410_03340 [Robiginitalea sp. M366]|uniref:hypothetical protein n=1 Tax=Robiginitalea aestuariiviva TaxID=3036903 RepID=UPI00240E647D|nr:hypothetical protein [Robiginitalea aestuariiviva]MDG1571333.1 hypothetical protein [Robiginitalea aestuariiviva]